MAKLGRQRPRTALAGSAHAWMMTSVSTPPLEAPAMRLPRFRFNVQRAMIAVAVAGLIVWAGMMWRRSVMFATRAAAHGARIAAIRRDLCFEDGATDEGRRVHLGHADAIERRIARDVFFRHKYEHAARYPWRFVAPDPK